MALSVMPIKPLDTLLAIKVISLMEGLRPSERRVATTLVEHYNRSTGRCDPSVERLAKLLGLSMRTVVRATNRLQQLKLIRKARHGGYSHRNLYEPNWLEFRNLEAIWRAKLKSCSRRSKVSLLESQPCHLPADTGVTQTCSSNLPSETYPRPILIERAPVHRRISVNSAEAAAASAERRWSMRLTRQFASTPAVHATIIEAIDDQLRNEATAIEMERRGGGMHHILRVLAKRGLL